MSVSVETHAGEPPLHRPRHPGEESLGKALRFSLIAHAFAFSAVLIKSVVFPGKPVPYVPTLRVDLVGLPDVLKKDLSKVPPAATSNDISEILKKAEANAKKIKPPEPVKLPKQAPIETAAPDEMVVRPKGKAAPDRAENRQQKLKGALDRIKALERIKGDVEETHKASKVVKGNMVSKGTSLSGDAREAAQASYYDQLREKLQEFWELPVWLARQQLSAHVLLFINPQGRVAQLQFTRVSGNAQFDEAVKRTITDSQPFPPPPQELAGSLKSDGILVRFPL